MGLETPDTFFRTSCHRMAALRLVCLSSLCASELFAKLHYFTVCGQKRKHSHLEQLYQQATACCHLNKRRHISGSQYSTILKSKSVCC